MHNKNPNVRARDIFEYLVLDADRTALAISRFAYEYALDAYKIRNEAEKILQRETVEAV